MEPSETRTPVPAAATCMIALAWSAAGWSLGLVGGGDAEAGAVVEGAVVQAGGAALGGLDHAGDGGGAVGGEDGLAGLDLDLEADPAGLQPVRLLEGLQEPDHGGDLLGVGHLGQGEDQPVGQAAGLHAGR